MPNTDMSPEIPQNPEKPKFEKSWLIESDEELKKLRSGELGTAGKKIAMLHITGLTNTLNADQLAERAAKWGEEAVEEGDEVWPELTPYLARIAEKVQTMDNQEKEKQQKGSSTGELREAGKAFIEAAEKIKGPDLTGIKDKSENEQRAQVQELLEAIESNTLPLDNTVNIENYNALNAVLDKRLLKEKVAKEVRARLRLHACFTLIERVTGKPEDYIKALRENVVKEMATRGLLFQGEGDLGFLYNDKESNLGIAKAHSILERLAFNGEEMGIAYLNKKGEIKYVRYAGDMTDEQSEQVQAYVLQEMGGDTPENRRAITLAERLAKATFEYSLWKDFRAVDPITKAAYFSNVRKNEREKTDGDFGPVITIDLIDGFGLSFLRWATDQAGNHIVHDEAWKKALEKSAKIDEPGSMRGAMEDLYKVNCICSSLGKVKKENTEEINQEYKDFELKPNEINYKNLPASSYASYLAGYVPAVIITTVNLLKSDYKPQDCTADNLTDWIGTAVKTDIPLGEKDKWPSSDPAPREVFRLRYYFSMGMIYEAVRQATILGWDAQQMGNVLSMLANGVGNKGGGEKTPLLSSSQVDKIRKAIAPFRLLGWNTFVTALSGVLRTRRG